MLSSNIGRGNFLAIKLNSQRNYFPMRLLNLFQLSFTTKVILGDTLKYNAAVQKSAENTVVRIRIWIYGLPVAGII